METKLLEAAARTGHAVVVIERATRSGAPTLPASLAHDRAKKYGDTTLWWVRPA